MEILYNKLIEKIDKKRIFLNEPMKNHTTFKVGGPADIFIKIWNIDELKYVLNVAKQSKTDITVIGNGSNLLVTDKGIRGITIKTDFKEINVDNEIITAEAGALLTTVSKIALEHSLSGLEFASGIPASIGGAVYMNSGAYGKNIGCSIIETTYIDENMNIKTIKNEEQDFGYRHSIFQEKNWIVLNAKFKLENGNAEEIDRKMKEYSLARREKQPLNMPSAGSVFKRPQNYYAAQIIEECGLKGYCIGDAEVSLKHAGFIVNNGNATAKDILNLIDYIKNKVKEKFEVELETEIKIIGEK